MSQKWSKISASQMRSYATEATRIIAFAEQHKISPFAAALAGVGLIRNAIALMDGEPAWWCRLIASTKTNPLEEFIFDVDN